MNQQRVDKIIKQSIKDIENSLLSKGKEYSTLEDRLKNFKEAATFNHTNPSTALWGMVTKHIIALSDFIRRYEKEEKVTEFQWLEKMGDIINYLILLRSILVEEEQIKETE